MCMVYAFSVAHLCSHPSKPFFVWSLCVHGGRQGNMSAIYPYLSPSGCLKDESVETERETQQ